MLKSTLKQEQHYGRGQKLGDQDQLLETGNSDPPIPSSYIHSHLK